MRNPTSPTVDAIRAHLSTPKFTKQLEGRIVAGVAEAWGAMLANEPSRFELESSFEELLALSRGGDCHYDRPTIGPLYASWYQARRVQTATLALLEPMVSREGDIAIVDLGGGSGAAWTAAAAIEEARCALGGELRHVSIHSVDSSVPMTDTARVLWETSRSTWEAAQRIDVSARVGNWTGPIETEPDPIVLASYLLDHSDVERATQVAELLHARLEQLRATRCLVVIASNKISWADRIVAPIIASGTWNRSHSSDPTPIWSGTLTALGELRRQLTGRVEGDLASLLPRNPTWDEPGGALGIIDLAREPYSDLLTANPQRTLLSPEQRSAATPDGRMTEILGSAGSGKSRVLIERLIAELEAAISGRRSVSVLVTTFNKALVGQLVAWFLEAYGASQILSEHTVVQSGGDGDVTISYSWANVVDGSIRFLNWDKAPTRLFGIGRAERTGENSATMRQIIERWTRSDKEGTRREWLDARPWVNERFITQELRRVVFGMEVRSEEQYQTVVRVGRGQPRLATQSDDRSMLWSLMMSDRRVSLFVDARIEMIQLLRENGKPKVVFDHLFIDEGQDFLDVEYSLAFPSLVTDPSAIVVAADPTQALHTGASYFPPRTIASADRSVSRLWKSHHLNGSYRLPLWVTDAVRPLARRVVSEQTSIRSGDRGVAEIAPADLVAPNSVKNAVPGARPILIAGDTVHEAAEDLANIIALHRELLPPEQRVQVTWVEADGSRRRALAEALAHCDNGSEIELDGGSMVQIKGLERPVVFWRTRDVAENIPGVSGPELVYTALTRTTCLLIIALVDNTPDDIRELVLELDERHICLWNEAAKRRFDEWKADTEARRSSVVPS